MATVAFPAGYNLERDSTFENVSNVTVDIMSDGTPRQRTTSATPYTSIACKFAYLTATDKQTLVTFLTTNAANTITWTIDGVNYSGVFMGNMSITMTGPLYNVTFTYYATTV
jgi:hypothetical protein